MRFQNRKVVVTGGTGALGAAVVELLVQEGAEVWVPVHGRKGAPVAGPGKVEFVEGVDLSDEAAVSAFYQKAGPLWASIHTAGGFSMSPIAETSKADFQKMFDSNALTAFLCCREAVKQIRAAGIGGRIVNVTAKPALHPVEGMTAYSVSKAAVLSLTLSLAEELSRESIWVNAVVPSIMDTPQNRASFPSKTDFSQWPSVADVAATLLFLASVDNRVTRGAAVPVYGKS
ncbi:MAG TPA: SDR family NAD(P)-dependent oxidoreductase [Phycisphaerae bacterium]|nr:SDR family NAD(P)-dependent oxidoreductase [Phycisphaerae bacterium]